MYLYFCCGAIVRGLTISYDLLLGKIILFMGICAILFECMILFAFNFVVVVGLAIVIELLMRNGCLVALLCLSSVAGCR